MQKTGHKEPPVRKMFLPASDLGVRRHSRGHAHENKLYSQYQYSNRYLDGNLDQRDQRFFYFSNK